jgi:queuine tRNA-ribosyltransferase subunit QTRTD1
VATPSLVIAAVEAGVDLFDSSFAVVAAERGGAFVFRVENDSSEDLTPPSDIVEMNLNQKEFAEDFGPILRNCTCYTCQTHTRAYLHHLLNTCELLAPVLLMVHNQYHYLKFFSCLRKALQANRWQEFRSRILSHLHEVPSGLDKRSSDDVGGDVGVVVGRKQKLKRITS